MVSMEVMGRPQGKGEGVRQVERTVDADRGTPQVPSRAACCGSGPASSTYQSGEQGNTQLNPERRLKRITVKGD